MDWLASAQLQSGLTFHSFGKSFRKRGMLSDLLGVVVHNTGRFSSEKLFL